MADTPQKSTTDFLDQSEIDKLLSQEVAQQAPKQHLIKANGQRSAAGAALKVEVYDFRNPVFLSEIELRRLRILHEDFTWPQKAA